MSESSEVHDRQYTKSYEPVFVVRFVVTQDLFGGSMLDGLNKFNVFNQ